MGGVVKNVLTVVLVLLGGCTNSLIAIDLTQDKGECDSTAEIRVNLTMTYDMRNGA